MIQSLSKPNKRIEMDLEEDKKPINKKNQTYKEVIRLATIDKNGRKINQTYEIKRQKFGKYIKNAYANHYDELNEKRLAGFTDIVHRIPIEALQNTLGISMIKENDLWTIRADSKNDNEYFPEFKGTLSKLKDRFDSIKKDDAFFLYHYAILIVATKIIEQCDEQLKAVTSTTPTLENQADQHDVKQNLKDEEDKQPVPDHDSDWPKELTDLMNKTEELQRQDLHLKKYCEHLAQCHNLSPTEATQAIQILKLSQLVDAICVTLQGNRPWYENLFSPFFKDATQKAAKISASYKTTPVDDRLELLQFKAKESNNNLGLFFTNLEQKRLKFGLKPSKSALFFKEQVQEINKSSFSDNQLNKSEPI